MLLRDFTNHSDELVDLRIGAGIAGRADDRRDSELACGKHDIGPRNILAPLLLELFFFSSEGWECGEHLPRRRCVHSVWSSR